MYDKNMWVVHYTCHENLKKIKRSRVIKSAWCLMNAAERKQHGTTPRKCSERINDAILRDQEPLTKGIAVDCDTKPGEYVEYLNQHIFFWPTRYEGNRRRKNFRNKYPNESAIFCRLCDLQCENIILYSRYNSGSRPREVAKYPRSCDLFKPIKSRESEPIVEIVVYGKVKLPQKTKYKKKGRARKFLRRNETDNKTDK